MEDIFEGASNDSEQQVDSVDKPENNGLPVAESATRDSLDITFSPELDSSWKPEPVSSLDSLKADVKSSSPGEAIILSNEELKTEPPLEHSESRVAVEPESKPIVL